MILYIKSTVNKHTIQYYKIPIPRLLNSTASVWKAYYEMTYILISLFLS